MIRPDVPWNLVTLNFKYSYFNKGLTVLAKAQALNNERVRDDGLLLIFTSKLGIISLKQHRGHIGNLRRQIYLLQR